MTSGIRWTPAQLAAHQSKPGVKPLAPQVVKPIVAMTGEGLTSAIKSHSREPITLTLPFPPSLNSYVRHIDVKTHLLSEKARGFKRAVMQIVSAAGITPLAGRLRMEIVLHPPMDGQRRDIDNYGKVAIDALMRAGCFVDDEQIDQLLITRGARVKGGSAHVTLTALGAQ